MQPDITPQITPVPGSSSLPAQPGQGPTLGANDQAKTGVMTTSGMATGKRGALPVVVAVLAVVGLLGLVGGGWAYYRSRPVKTEVASNDGVTYKALSQSGIKLESANVSTQQLVITGKLKANGQIVVAPTVRPNDPTLGLIYFDDTDRMLYLYDGSKFEPLTGTAVSPGQGPAGPAGPQGKTGASGTNGTNGFDGSGIGVLSLQGLTGNLLLTSSVGGVVITPSGSSVAVDLPQDLRVTDNPVFASLNLNGPLKLASVDALSKQVNGAILLGDNTGNGRGINALDLQSGRTDPTHVAAGDTSVAVGYDNTAGAGGNIGVAMGVQNIATGWISTALGFYSSSTNYFDTSLGVGARASGGESTAIGRIAYALGFLSNSLGYQNTASGALSTAVGGRAIAGGQSSAAFGGSQDYTTHALGDQSVAIGTRVKVGGNLSSVFGGFSTVGYTERVFTIPANGTTVTIAGGDFTAEFANGDAVLITMNQDWGNTLNSRKTISAVTYNSGPNTTTFTINSAIDTTTTTGRVIDQQKAQRSGAFGYTNTVTANDAYALGSNITNSLQGSVMIGTSNATKATIYSNGTISTVAAYAFGGVEAFSKQGNGAILLGDITGNSRGVNALDIQVSRTLATQVASGDGSIAVGSNNAATTVNTVAVGTGNVASAAALYNSNAVGSNNSATGIQVANAFGASNIASGPSYADAFGNGNVASSFNTSAFGLLNTASAVNTSAFGQINTITAQEAQGFGRFNAANAFGGQAFGGFNIATGAVSSAFGNGNFSAGVQSNAYGYTNNTYGTQSNAVGAGNSASGTNSSVFGTGLTTGYLARTFAVSAGGTTVTITGGDYTSEFVNGDTVVLSDHPFPPVPAFAAAYKTISAVTFNGGPNTTTFTISSAIDGTTTAGQVVSQTRAARSGIFGYNNTVTVADAYILGSGITNNVAGSVMIGSSNSNKLTLDSSGRLGLGTTTPGNLLSVGALTTASATSQVAVSTGGMTNSGIVIQTVASQSGGYMLQAQDSTGAALASIDYLGNLIVKNATINGHIISGNSSGSSSFSVGAAGCSGGTVTGSVGNDTAGKVVINTGGSGCTSGVMVTVTFANSYGAAPAVVMTPGDSVTAAANLEYFVTPGTTDVTLSSANTTTAGQTYTFYYHVIQ